jgi:hypothetical protein
MQLTCLTSKPKVWAGSRAAARVNSSTRERGVDKVACEREYNHVPANRG